MPLRSRFFAPTSCLFFVLSAAGCAGSTSPKTPVAPAVVPLRSLRLYETGVGYFERSGPASGGEQALPVPAGHLDDALKSLVLLGASGDVNGGAEITGVQLSSQPSKGFARAQAGLPAADGPITYRDVLASLRGASVTVVVKPHQAPASSPAGERPSEHELRGRLVEVEDGEKAAGKQPVGKGSADTTTDESAPGGKEMTLTILGSSGRLVRVSTRDIVSVAPDDPALVKRLSTALDVLSPRSAQATRLLRLRSKGPLPITFGYIAEAPIWRTSYRLVLDKTGPGATLQSWALVHNDTDEDWRGVALSLVNGRPDSFLFPLAAPRYGRRQLVHPDVELSTVPQLLDTTVDALWGDRADIGESFGASGIGLSGVGEGGGGRGEGIGLGSVGTVTSESSLVGVGNLAAVQTASAEEGTAQFTYTSRTPLDLGAHSSGLVPLLSSPVTVEPVAFFADPFKGARAALRFTNSTGQTLPAGTLAIFEGGGFAGESALDRLKPGEARLISFGQELDVTLNEYRDDRTDEPKHVTWDGHALTEHFLRTRRVSFELENRSGRERSVVLRFSVHHNAKLEGIETMRFDPATQSPELTWRSAAHTLEKHPFTAIEGLATPHPLANLSRDRVEKLALAETLPANERAALKDVATKLLAREEGTRAVTKAEADVARVERDLERLRAHVEASKGGGAGRDNPLVKRVLDAEDALTAARKRVEKAETDAVPREKALREALEKLPKPS